MEEASLLAIHDKAKKDKAKRGKRGGLGNVAGNATQQHHKVPSRHTPLHLSFVKSSKKHESLHPTKVEIIGHEDEHEHKEEEEDANAQAEQHKEEEEEPPMTARAKWKRQSDGEQKWTVDAKKAKKMECLTVHTSMSAVKLSAVLDSHVPSDESLVATIVTAHGPAKRADIVTQSSQGDYVSVRNCTVHHLSGSWSSGVLYAALEDDSGCAHVGLAKRKTLRVKDGFQMTLVRH
ncbi:unnamed protein product [Vitrella brassicaformis CCMP3155]|uniref:Uncharacterized protein n=2 Tax=Vitrella brassicaformis TaxID=1169539 RepID=A0A0G4GUC4_VITBC|nr:unnamed protein product [Vitrella brassicaformis CCMP3155]|mmetsp:Transcript_5319/g.12551  ORF Transcript_5319/g.12551 Transcript_5319/m.12551 type:complete len:234 (+) Transcript_5319:106-807(+)|eukprot:CEM34439.1 unnamed protein product [Vitrella brassicaformis CCMP3155]